MRRGAELGAAVGLALLGSLGTAVYRATIATALPAGLPPDVSRTARAALSADLHRHRILTTDPTATPRSRHDSDPSRRPGAARN